MIKRKVYFTLDCAKPGSQHTIEGLHVGDARSCELHIHLRNGITPLVLDDENIEVIMNAQKPDGTTISALCDISADKKEVLYTPGEQDTAVAGIVQYALVVSGYDGEEYRCLHSASFISVVSKGVLVPYYDSENDYAAFEETVAKVQQLTTDKEDKSNKVASISISDLTDTTKYPSNAAVTGYLEDNYLKANQVYSRAQINSYLDELDADKADAAAVDEALATKEDKSNKVSSITQGRTGRDASVDYPNVSAVRQFVDERLEPYALEDEIPTAVSELENDSGYVTGDDVGSMISGKADKATTLAGYGIVNAYTKDEANAAFAGSAAVSKNRAEMTGGAIVPEMERGSIRNNPTDYIPTNNYIRTKQGFSMWLNPGAVISFSGNTNIQYFCWLTLPNGTYSRTDNLTGDYIVQEFGFYQIVISVAGLTDADVAALIASIRVQNTAAVGEQGAQALAPLLLGRHPYDYPYVAFAFNASAQTVTMTIPRNSKILIPGETINLVGDNNSALTVNCVVSNKNSTKIVYDKATQMVKAIAWDSTDSHHVLIAAVSYNFTGSGNSKVQLSVSINAPYRINNRCADMPFSEVLAPIAIGYDSNQRRNYVEVDTSNKTITFPANTLIFAGEANGFVSVNNGSQLVVDYSDKSLGGSGYYGVMKLYFDTATKQIFISQRNSIQYGMYPLVAVLRVPISTADKTLPSIAINAPAVIDNHFGGFIDQTQPKNGLIQQISHRGYNTVAPENTLPAFRLAKKMGFDTVETDVQRTADGEYICIHDGTINDRVAQNADGLTLPVNIADITLEQAQQYDVGKVKGAVSEKYQGTRIPSLAGALQLCRAIGLKMYIELKRETLYTDVSAADQETYVRDIMRIIHTNGMSQHVAIYSGVPELLGLVKAISSGTTLIYGCEAITPEILSSAIALKNGTNKVVLSVNAANCQKSTDNIDNYVAICASNGIQMGAWFASTEGNGSLILTAHPYVSGFMCNSLLPGNVLYDNAIG